MSLAICGRGSVVLLHVCGWMDGCVPYIGMASLGSKLRSGMGQVGMGHHAHDGVDVMCMPPCPWCTL